MLADGDLPVRDGGENANWRFRIAEQLPSLLNADVDVKRKCRKSDAGGLADRQRRSGLLLGSGAAQRPACRACERTEPKSSTSEAASSTASLSRNCPGAAEIAGKPPAVCSATPGVEAKKVRVMR